MYEEQLQQVALSLLPGIGPVTIRQLISYCGSASGVFSASQAKLSNIPGVGYKTAQSIKSNKDYLQAEAQLKMATAIGASVHFFNAKDYPIRLKRLEDGPVLLYCKGKPAYDYSYTIGIVGTRRPTPYAISVIRKVITHIYPYRPTIISGLAYGVDIAAHLEALKHDLPTVAVLGSGLDRIYPDVHKSIAEKMLEQGGLVSELRFGTKPEMYHFPSRNRIIAGLSDALLVIEARNKGGALITAEYCRNYRKPCFAVPGAIDAPASFGCNQLIKQQKAFLMTSGEDIVNHLGWSSQIETSTRSYPPENSQEQILEILRNCPQGVHIDRLCHKSQIPINKMAALLLKLEVKGLIKANPGNKFALARK